jgi:hypothetical protein
MLISDINDMAELCGDRVRLVAVLVHRSVSEVQPDI